jgi:hypothetical protein
MKRIGIAALLLIAMAAADSLSVPLGDVAFIRTKEHGRLLASFDLTEIPESSYIYYAEILTPCNLNEQVSLECRRITRGWTRGAVTWVYPWRTPGGDFDSTSTALYTFVPGRHKALALDITRYVQHWVSNGHMLSYGLLFTKGLSKEPGFKKLEMVAEALKKARVRVIYRRPVKQTDWAPGKQSVRD